MAVKSVKDITKEAKYSNAPSKVWSQKSTRLFMAHARQVLTGTEPEAALL